MLEYSAFTDLKRIHIYLCSATINLDSKYCHVQFKLRKTDINSEELYLSTEESAN